LHSVIIRRRSLVDDALRWLAAGVPDRLLRLWRGPAASGEIGASGLVDLAGTGWLRPVNLSVLPEAMLPMRLVIPTEGRHELRHAVALAIRQDTPFESDEVVAQAVEVERRAGSETYLVHAVPRRLIADAVRKIGHRRLGRIVAGPVGGPDLAEAMLPWRKMLRWRALLPVVVILGVAAVGAHDLLAEQDGRAEALEGEVAAALAELRQLSGELDVIEAKAAAGNQIAAAITAAPPAFVQLEGVRRALPPTSEVVQVELRTGELLLSLRSLDSLGDMARFVEAGWSASIEGAITADPASGREIAMLRLSQGGR